MAIDIENPGGAEADLIAALRDLVGTQFIRVAVSSVELLALHGAPKTVIAAPGAGKMISVFDLKILYNYGTTAYDGENADVTVGYGADTAYWVGFASLTDAADTVSHMDVSQLTGSINSTNFDNIALVAWTGETPFQNGDGSIVIDVLYRIVDLP